ncbi:YdcF family protein [Azospirillum thermophilum]|uniref:YdcF family protein n=1 Tax=Azospirillum thermophilum TaxID=2202148 RepID=A0A2S2CR91_9PROT|nr:YdcF family protein [Azospirillum thermophilum]AWK87002.1 YdcF family protein [Azospirillum thermophilum]
MLSFALSKLFWMLAMPGNALILMMAAGALLLRSRRWQRAGRRLVTLAALLGLLAGFTAFGPLVALPLENRFPRPELPAHIDGLIVLGGAVNPPITADRGDPSVNDAAERLLAFADLARRYPDARAVFTGGSGRLFDQTLKEDDSARGALREAGLAEGRVVFEADSRNTWENALYSRRLLDPKPGEVWVLVTSAMHMPRSVGIFRRIGWEVIPYPVDYRTTHDAKPYLRYESARTLMILEDAVREWIGLVSYRLMDRTDALFPAP